MRHELHEPSINALIGTFLRAVRDGEATFTIPMTHINDWDVKQMHSSDLGKCPRQISHRLHNDQMKPKSFATLDGEARQFYMANTIHHLVYNACAWDDRLIEFEIDLSPWLPDGFTGEADMVWMNFFDTPELLDAKSLHPNWRTYIENYPLFHNKCQVDSYYWALRKRSTHIDKAMTEPCLYYVGRGDKTRGLECRWEPDPDVMRREVDKIMTAVAMDPQDVPPLPKVIKKSGGSRLSKIEYAPAWDCEYCDYEGLMCVPHDMKSNALLYKKFDKNVGANVWAVSKLGLKMAAQVELETGVNLADLNAITELGQENAAEGSDEW